MAPTLTRETFQGRLLQGSSPEQPMVLADGKLQLACGCHVYVGIRLDTNGPATAAAPCSLRHRVIIDDFLALLTKFPYRQGESKALLDHAADLLLEAAR